jgi:hypothetical protein
MPVGTRRIATADKNPMKEGMIMISQYGDQAEFA